MSALPNDKITGDQKHNADGVYYHGCDTCLDMHAVPRVEVLDFKGVSAVQEAQTILHTLFVQWKNHGCSHKSFMATQRHVFGGSWCGVLWCGLFVVIGRGSVGR